MPARLSALPNVFRILWYGFPVPAFMNTKGRLFGSRAPPGTYLGFAGQFSSNEMDWLWLPSGSRRRKR